MKTLIKLFILIPISIPILLRADNLEEEIKYKHYIEVESDVHYEANPEDICEYFDKSDFIYSNESISFSPVEEKENRVIEEQLLDITVDRHYVNQLAFYGVRKTLSPDSDTKIREMEILDKDGNKICYSIRMSDALTSAQYINDNDYNTYSTFTIAAYFVVILDNYVNIDDLTIRFYYIMEDNAPISEIKIYGRQNDLTTYTYDYRTLSLQGTCDDFGSCYLNEKVKPKKAGESFGKVRTIIYKYKDPIYKCYTPKKIYVPGYFTSLEGFYKDENDFIKVAKEKTASEYESEIDSLNVTLNYKNLELSNLYSNYSNALDKINDLNNKINLLNITNEENALKINELITSMNAKEEMLNNLNQMIDELTLSNSELTTSIKDKDEMIMSLNQNKVLEINEKDKLIESLNKLIDKLKQEKIDLTTLLDIQENNINEYVKLTNKLKEDNNLKLEEVEELNNNVEILKSRIIEGNDLINSLTIDNNNLVNKINYDKNVSLEEINKYLDIIDKDNQEINTLQNYIQNLKLENEDLSKEESEDLLAYNTPEITKIKYQDISLFLNIFGIMSLIISLLLTIKNVKISRTK